MSVENVTDAYRNAQARLTKSGPMRACNAAPALTDTEQARFDMALIPDTGGFRLLQGVGDANDAGWLA